MVTYAAVLSTLVSLASAAPRQPLVVRRAADPVRPHSYIVVHKNPDVSAAHAKWIDTQVANANTSWVAKTYNFANFSAYHAILDPADPAISMADNSALKHKDGSPMSILDAIRVRPDVVSIEEDQVMKVFQTTPINTQATAPWGLQRISNPRPLPPGSRADELDFSFSSDPNAGRGVDVYVVDTGINTRHRSFEGRARFGSAAPGFPPIDDFGHGTHCAGTIASKDFGVAKAANLVAVKVLDDRGQGDNSNIIAGVEFAVQSAISSGRPSVISMSLGGGSSPALDAAVTGATRAGVHVVVAAGNEDQDARTTSPAEAPAVITVGASRIDDTVAGFSNFGPAVDIFAPGDTIISTSNKSPTATEILSGTSMACPHVAGIVATILSTEGQMSPRQMSNRLKQLALKGALKGVPSGTSNLLAQLPPPQRGIPQVGSFFGPRSKRIQRISVEKDFA